MRLAFDKPTIIIKDERTNYSFDIGGILHLEYPSSLRHNKIEKFKADLCKHALATYAKSKADPNYSPFLKSFGKHIVPKSIEKTEISEGQYIIEKLDFLNSRLLAFENKETINPVQQFSSRVNIRNPSLREKVNEEEKDSIKKYILEQFPMSNINKASSGEFYYIKTITESVNSKFKLKLSEPETHWIILELFEVPF